MKSRSVNCILLLLIVLFSCADEAIYDKLTRLEVTSRDLQVLECDGTTCIITGNLLDFDVRDYKGVDEVKFVVAGACNSSDPDVIYSLYDLTNGNKIEGTGVTIATGECNVNIYSNDIKDKFPKQRIDLGIIVSESVSVSIRGTYIYVYRK